MSSKQRELKEFQGQKLQIEKDKLRGGAVNSLTGASFGRRGG